MEGQYSLEVKILEFKLCLDYPCGFNPRPQNVLEFIRGIDDGSNLHNVDSIYLLCRSVVWGGDSVQSIEIIRRTVIELVFSGPVEAGLDAVVMPEPLHDHPKLIGQLAILARGRGHREELSCVILKHDHQVKMKYSYGSFKW